MFPTRIDEDSPKCMHISNLYWNTNAQHLGPKIFEQMDIRNICTKTNIKRCMDVMNITRYKLRLEFRKIIPLKIIVSTVMKSR
jgi:hypothetical protein